MQALNDNQIESSAESTAREPVNEQAMAAILLFLLPFIVASLLKPRFLEPNNDPKALHVRIESLWSVSLGLAIIIITLTSVVAFLLAIFVDHSLLGMEKVVFVQLSLLISATALLIANNRQFLVAQLEILELEASTARDETMHMIQSIQIVLSRLNHQLEGATQEEITSVSSLIKSLAPLAMMVINQEKNVFRLGFAAAAAAKNGMSFLRSFNK
jgi:hypothetical protein